MKYIFVYLIIGSLICFSCGDKSNDTIKLNIFNFLRDLSNKEIGINQIYDNYMAAEVPEMQDLGIETLQSLREALIKTSFTQNDVIVRGFNNGDNGFSLRNSNLIDAQAVNTAEIRNTDIRFHYLVTPNSKLKIVVFLNKGKKGVMVI